MKQNNIIYYPSQPKDWANNILLLITFYNKSIFEILSQYSSFQSFITPNFN